MKNEDKEDKLNLIYSLTLVTQIGITVSVTVWIFISIGKFLDGYFSVSPLFTIIGAIAALIASIYEVYHLMLPVIEEGEKKKKK